MSPFSAPFFWSTQKRGLLLPKRVAALWEGPMLCVVRSHESRSREAAGRRNWPEQCPGKCAAEKGMLTQLSEYRDSW